MAGSKLTPRQKMINMMYLVLTALLALNVSKEIIHAFVTMSNSLEVTNKSTDLRNDMAFMAFEKQMQTDEAKTKPHYERAKKAKALSEALLKDIDMLKAEIIRKTEKLADTAAIPKLEDIRKQDDFDTPTNILCGKGETGQVAQDGKDSQAKILRAKLNKYKVDMVANLDPKDQPEFKKRFDEIFKLEDPSKEEQKVSNKKTWEMVTFYHNPVVASCALLTKFQTDIKNSESEVLNKLLENINARDIKFTDVEAKVVAPTSYILVGQQYKAEVFLAAFNKTAELDAYVGGSKLPVENGMAQYSASATSEGLKKWGGVIRVKNPMDPTKYDEYKTPEVEYIVARPAAVISPTKMNVIYIGIENPISISVPGVPNEKVKVTPSGGGLTVSKVAGGSGEQWIAKATTQGESTITCSADFDGKNMTMGMQKFRIKRVPDPVAMIGQNESGPMAKATLMAQPSVNAIMKDFEFELFFRVTKFKMTFQQKGKDPVEIESASNLITPAMKEALSRSRTGDKVYFEYIQASGPDGTSRRLKPVNIVVQ